MCLGGVRVRASAALRKQGGDTDEGAWQARAERSGGTSRQAHAVAKGVA